jgi:hypothetical protein
MAEALRHQGSPQELTIEERTMAGSPLALSVVPKAEVTGTGAIAPVFLSLSGLTKRYGAITVVQDVSLDVAPGEFVFMSCPPHSKCPQCRHRGQQRVNSIDARRLVRSRYGLQAHGQFHLLQFGLVTRSDQTDQCTAQKRDVGLSLTHRVFRADFDVLSQNLNAP